MVRHLHADENIIIAVAALALGAVAGWFVGGVGERGTGNGEWGMVGRVVPNAPMTAAWDKPPYYVILFTNKQPLTKQAFRFAALRRGEI